MKVTRPGDTLHPMQFEALFRPPAVPQHDEPVTVRPLLLGPEGRRAWIIDNVIDTAALEPLHGWFKQLDYRFADSDRDDTAFVRHLVHYFSAEECTHQTRVALLVATAQSALDSLGLEPGALERVYANFNLFGDQQFAHPDGDCWTALLFLNSAWAEDWGGELLLYDGGPGSLAWAIPPRPGRLVVFDGQILHRGGVPTKFCLDARITLAIKFSRV